MGADSLLSVLLSLVLGLELVNLVETLGLEETGKGGGSEATDDLLGLGMLNDLACMKLDYDEVFGRRTSYRSLPGSR